MADDVALPVVRERFVDLLPDNHKPVLSGDSDRPREADATVAEARPEVQQANDLAAQDKEKADADALAKAKSGDEPTEPVKADAEPVKEPKHDETPPWMKARISKEENRRKAVEEQLSATQKQLNDTLELARRFMPDPNAATPEPRRDTFSDPDEYIEARAQWRAEQIVATRQAEQTRKAQESESQKIQREHQDRIAVAEAKYPGIADVAKDPTLPVNDAMGAAIVTSDNGPDILHYLDEHRDEAKRIYSLPPARAAAEIGKIEASLTAPKAAPKPSAAPRPITPVGGSGGVVRNKYDPGITDSEYFALVDQEQSARLAQLRGTAK